MRRFLSYNTTALCLLSISIGQMLSLAAEADEVAEVEKRAFVLAGYIPKFYEIPEVHDHDPFETSEANLKEHGEKIKEYERGIVTFLRRNGIAAAEIEFDPDQNCLFLTDTPDNLAGDEIVLRGLFRPDMQLWRIEGAARAFDDRKIFEGDRLYRVGFLSDITFRSFHNEVRKLEDALGILPEEHRERKAIIERIEIAKKYRESAIKFYLQSLEEQRTLIKNWQKESEKTEQDAEP